jgi:hypothetical protein
MRRACADRLEDMRFEAAYRGHIDEYAPQTVVFALSAHLSSCSAMELGITAAMARLQRCGASLSFLCNAVG